MSLNRLELLSVKAADGLASAADLAELEAAGVELRWDAARALLREGLLPGQLPELAPGVLGSLGLVEDADVTAAVCDALRAAGPDMAPGVLAALGLSEELDVTASVRDALLAEGPDLVAGVLGALELEEEADVSDAVQDALLAEGPDLVSGIFEALGLEEDADVTASVRDALHAEGPDLVGGIFGALELEEDADVAGAVRAALVPEQAPELADDVLASLGLSDGALGDAVAQALRAEGPELADDVMAALGADASVGDVLRDALGAGGAPDLWSGVAAEIGAEDEVGDALRDALAAEAAPDLWSGIAAEIGAEEEHDAAPAAEVAGAGNVVSLRNWTSAGLGAVLAIAAAMLLMVVSGQGGPGGSPELVFEVAEVVNNTAEIEELEYSADAMVQFFQTEEGAPTIMFINELEPADAGEVEGVQL